MHISSRIIVTNSKLKTFCEQGTIEEIVYLYPEPTYRVELDNGIHITIKESNIRLVTNESEQKGSQMTAVSDNEKYLAFIHYHDYDWNPTDLEDALDLFGEEEIGQPGLVVYGTKAEILERILEDPALHSYENTFILLNQNVYPLKKSVTVDW